MNDDQKNKTKAQSTNLKASEGQQPGGAQPPQAPVGSGLTSGAAGAEGTSSETLDGKPPGAHAPMGIGTGAPVDNTPVGDRPKDPTLPQNPVDDPTISPKAQAQHSLEVDAQQKGEGLGPLAEGHTRVRLTENITVGGRHRLAGETVDLPEADVHSLHGKFEPA